MCTCTYKNEIASDELFALSDLSNDKNAVNSLAKIVQQLMTKVGELEHKIEQVKSEKNSDIESLKLKNATLQSYIEISTAVDRHKMCLLSI